MTFLTKLDYSDNRQIKQFQLTNTQLSGTTVFGVPDAYIPESSDDTINIDALQFIQTRGIILPNSIPVFTGSTYQLLGRDNDTGKVVEVTDLSGGTSGGTPSWQDTVDVSGSVSSTDNTSAFLDVNRYVTEMDFDMHDPSYTNNIYMFVGDSATGNVPGFSMDGDPDVSGSWFTVDIGGVISLEAKSANAIISAESIFAAEPLKRKAQLFLDIDDAILSTNNPNTNQGGYLEIIGTSERVRLGHRNGSGIDNRFELQKPTSGNSSLIVPALNLPAFNDKYVPIYITDGTTTVEADNTGLVNISTLVGPTTNIQKAINDNYSILSGDNNTLLVLSATTSKTITYDSGLTENFAVEFINIGTGTWTHTQGTGSLNNPDGTIMLANRVAMMIHIGTSGEYWLKGELE